MKKIAFFILFTVGTCMAFTACSRPDPLPDDKEGTRIYEPIVMPDDD